jgi:hypothetical protein
MSDERDASKPHKLFRHDAHELHYLRFDRIKRNGTRSVELSLWGFSLKMCR